MDGTAWPGPVDVAINGGAYWRQVDWAPLAASARRCFGPDYLCIRPSLVAQRPSPRRLGGRVERVLVTLGGSDPHGATPAVLASIGRAAATLRAAGHAVPLPEVVVGPGSRHEASLVAALRGLDTARGGPGAVVHRAAGDLGPLMARAGLAVAAGGSTLYELAFFGTPAIAIPQTLDEALNAAAVAAASACVALPRDRQQWEELLPDTLLRLLQDPRTRSAMSTAGQALVDGQGAARVAAAIEAAAA
jgi:spore coat polysaccharide biosynthesis predicted glycosyltransferase SpsG